MTVKSPFKIIRHRHVTEKAAVLEQLHTSVSNKSLARCDQAKYVFIVDPDATKTDIRKSIEEIYSDRNVKVVGVNTITGQTKPRHLRGRKARPGRTPKFKKAIVTLAKGDTLEEV